MGSFRVESKDVPDTPLFDPQKFAHSENEDGSWTHIYLARDREQHAWFKCVRGDGKGGVFTEYIDVSKLLRDWSAYAGLLGLGMIPGEGSVSGV